MLVIFVHLKIGRMFPFSLVYWYTWKRDIFLHFFIVLMYFQEGWWNGDVHWHHVKNSKLNLKGFHSVQNNFNFNLNQAFYLYENHSLICQNFFFPVFLKASPLQFQHVLSCSANTKLCPSADETDGSLLGHFKHFSQCGGLLLIMPPPETTNTGPAFPGLLPSALSQAVWWIWPVRSSLEENGSGLLTNLLCVLHSVIHLGASNTVFLKSVQLLRLGG